MIIGIYKLWSMFSYVGLLFGIISIYFAKIQNFKLALLSLMFSSLLFILKIKIKRYKSKWFNSILIIIGLFLVALMFWV